ncbi:MAG: type 1 glutamine amidotransferase domain-containing protein [Bacteroidia bacterium]
MKLFDFLFPFKSKGSSKSYNFKSRKAVIIGSNQASLDRLDANGKLIKKGKATGVHASELTEAYYLMMDSGIKVDLASIKGGLIPLDPLSLLPTVRTEADKRMRRDPELLKSLESSLPIAELNATDYDLIYIAGGWAAAYDLEQSSDLAKFIEDAAANNKVLVAVCHGPLGFCRAKKSNGEALLKDVKVTGVTNSQLKQLGVFFTPKHPETSLMNAGADYSKSKHWLSDLFSQYVVIDEDLKMVTGQNQKCTIAAVEKAFELL